MFQFAWFMDAHASMARILELLAQNRVNPVYPAVNQLSSLCLQRTQLEHNPPSPPPLHPPQYPPLNPQLPRHIKLNFPRFNGGEPTEWLTKIKQYSAYRGVPRVQQVSFVSYHLTEEANEWWFATSKVLGTDPNNSPW